MRCLVHFGLLILVSCSHMAPSNYELDRRTGWGVADLDNKPNLEKEINQFGVGGRLVGGTEKKEADWPQRLPATLEKIWIYDQKLGDHWMQGTWVFIEVEKERWVSDLEVEAPLRRMEFKAERLQNED